MSEHTAENDAEALTEMERTRLRIAVDRDETDETDGPYNDTRHVFAAVERILAARLDAARLKGDGS